MQHQFKRRLFYGTNVTLGIVLGAALAAMANVLASKYHCQHDFQRAKDMYTLSEKTLNVFDSLSNDVEFFVFSNTQDSELGRHLDRLLKSYETASRRVKVTLMDSLTDIAKVRRLEKELEVTEPDSVAIRYQGRKKILTEMKMADFRFGHDEYTGGQIKKMTVFKAEQAFTSALLELMNPQKLMARFTVKHGERNLYVQDDTGLSELRRRLDNDNVIAEPLELVGMNDIAATNCDLLIVAGPTRKFMEHEINLLRRYLSKGGRAIVMLDPQLDTAEETGLEPLLAEFNVKVGRNLVVDPGTRIEGSSPLLLIVGLYGDHLITRSIGSYTQFLMARSIGVLDENNDVNRATMLAETTDRGWGETDSSSDKIAYNKGTDLEGPVSIAVAVENEKSGMRLVVVGDADFAANMDFYANTANRDFFLNSVNWLLQRDFLVGIGPKTLAERRLRLTKGQYRILSVFVLAITPLLAASAGVVVYFIRRK